MASESQLTNPLGIQIWRDGANPRTFTATAIEVISGGTLVCTSGATGDVGSQISSISNGDIRVMGTQDRKLFNGIALNNAGSNELVTVATRGDYLMRAAGIVSGGALVGHNASGNVLNWTPFAGTGSAAVLYDKVGDAVVGKAITTSASGTNYYALVSINA